MYQDLESRIQLLVLPVAQREPTLILHPLYAKHVIVIAGCVQANKSHNVNTVLIISTCMEQYVILRVIVPKAILDKVLIGNVTYVQLHVINA